MYDKSFVMNQKEREGIPLYVPRAKELTSRQTRQHSWTQLSHTFLPGRASNSRHPQAGPAESLRSSLAAHRLTFCAIRRIRKRTIGWISQVIVLLLLTVSTAFHVPAFQRNHRKRLAPFFWNAVRVQLVLSPLDQRSSHDAEQVPDHGVWWSQVADATVETV